MIQLQYIGTIYHKKDLCSLVRRKLVCSYLRSREISDNKLLKDIPVADCMAQIKRTW